MTKKLDIANSGYLLQNLQGVPQTFITFSIQNLLLSFIIYKFVICIITMRRAIHASLVKIGPVKRISIMGIYF